MRVLTFISLCLILCPELLAQPIWDLKKDKGGIQVYTARTTSAYRSVKVVCNIKTTPAKALAMIQDVEKHPEWVYAIKSGKVLKRNNEQEFIYYSEIDAPWPCDNRDFIAIFKIMRQTTDTIVADSHVLPDYLPRNKGIVRVTKSETHWLITDVANGHSKVEYVVSFIAGGSIPPWIINMFIAEGPYHTFKNLKARLEKK